MTPRPQLPAVLILVNRDSQLEIFQDEDVQIAFVDERVDIYSVILIPRENQAQELNDRLVDKYIFSPAEDLAGTAENAVRQLRALNVITAGREVDGRKPS